jgi:hypothetical protein
MIKYIHNLHKKYIQKKFEYSHAGQDIFAKNLIGKNGTYLEVGAYLPVKNSNTYLLESKYNWRGVSIEMDINHKDAWLNNKERKNKIYFEDALSFKYKERLIENNLPLHINYLSCDIDPTFNTYNALKKIINEGISFDFISFEHDEYFRKNCTNDINDYHALAINFLKKNNYKIAIDNVYPKNKPEKLFETWFINNSITFDKIEYIEWKKLNL